MTSMNPNPRRRRVVIGVDTHKHVHVAVALGAIGGRLDSQSFAADRTGYEQLIQWALAFGAKQLTFAIEGTGSYGVGLTAAVRRRDVGVVEVLRTGRRDRRLRGKSDTLDTENAARRTSLSSERGLEDQRRHRGDAASDQNREGHSPHPGDDQPQDGVHYRNARTARGTAAAVEDEADHPVRRTTPGSGR